MTESRSAAKSGGAAAAPLGIVPLPAGDVSIFFPAAKETSRLKFHIHAPFASTVARDSVRDTPENAQLVADIGDLIVSHLNGFRDRGVIDDGLLATLPNAEDDLKTMYGRIRSVIVDAFNDEDLTPVRGGGGLGVARSLVPSPSEFRVGLEESDLRYLLQLGGARFAGQPRWILDRDGRAGRFLRDPDTMVFGWDELSSALSPAVDSHEDPDTPSDDVSRAWHAWLEAKNDERILSLYELLGQDSEFELGSASMRFRLSDFATAGEPCTSRVLRRIFRRREAMP